ncbi:MMPL family transporter [Crossiella cryophila]|uniref:RND superfamily putative drug exporter n=1 Tax=Crossiella cryophila TaxID=43355 RepID=A0A7W7CHL3_9PSEU|nr:MMPL family transporter [Crossiella cryophila]MBB4681400.1 RND superfamily putative drug exporter [Crossiella cryophila]
MDRLTDALFRNSRLIVVAWILLAITGGAFAIGLEGRAVPGGEASSTSQAESVARELSRNGVPALFVVVTGKAATAEGAGELKTVRDKIAATEGVREVMPLALPPAKPGTGPLTVFGVSSTGGIDGSIGVANKLLDIEGLAPGDSEVFLGGYGAHREELVQLSRSDLLRAEQVGLPIVLVVLLLTFGTLWATLVPLAIGASALLGGLGAAGALAFGIPFSEYVTNSATMVGLALAIDYAMFLVQRVRELLLGGLEVDDAVRTAMRTTGVAVAWSGLTVIVAEAGMFMVDSRAIQTAALGMMLVTAMAIVAALIGAPIVLRALGHRILRKKERARLAAGEISTAHMDGEMSGFWGRWGVRVTKRPFMWLVAGTAVLAALCLPVLDLVQKVDLPTASQMPEGSQVRQSTELGAKAFGPGVFAPVEIVVHGSSGEVRGNAERIARTLTGNPDVLAARPIPLENTEAYRVSVATTHSPSDDRTHELVRDLRSGSLHDSLSGIRYEVGGETAMRIDATDALFASLPLMLLVLLGLVLLLLIVAMRSIVLPIKAVLLVVISLGASIGGLLLLSTTEIGARIIGWSDPADLHPIVPITIVSVVIALSTDYEVILISRIAERYRETGDNTGSIIDGVARTGRVISSAAAIMIAIFFGFALSDVTPLKQLGVGLAFAVLIDATVIRGVLVPASMQLMGRWNWWFPGKQERNPDSAQPLGDDRLGEPDRARQTDGSPAGATLRD